VFHPLKLRPLASTDGVNFTPFATIADPTTRAYTAAGLDPLTPYGSWATAQAPILHSTVDMPGLPLVGRSFASIHDHFSMFIMYQPPGPGSKWVALQVLNWRFNIAATRNGGAWTVDAGHGRAPGSWTIPVQAPKWTRIHLNGTQEHD